MRSTRETWETYASAWKAADAPTKRAALARSVGSAAIYRDPLAQCAGHEELVGYMLDFHKQVPGGHFQTTYFQAHNGRSIAKWNMVNQNGQTISDGVSFGEYGADGKLVAMTGFFETPETK